MNPHFRGIVTLLAVIAIAITLVYVLTPSNPQPPTTSEGWTLPAKAGETSLPARIAVYHGQWNEYDIQIQDGQPIISNIMGERLIMAYRYPPTYLLWWEISSAKRDQWVFETADGIEVVYVTSPVNGIVTLETVFPNDWVSKRVNNSLPIQ